MASQVSLVCQHSLPNASRPSQVRSTFVPMRRVRHCALHWFACCQIWLPSSETVSESSVGGGKTHSMIGAGATPSGESRGIIPRACERFFERVSTRGEHRCENRVWSGPHGAHSSSWPDDIYWMIYIVAGPSHHRGGCQDEQVPFSASFLSTLVPQGSEPLLVSQRLFTENDHRFGAVVGVQVRCSFYELVGEVQQSA